MLRQGHGEFDECVCEDSKCADANKDGKVSKEELAKVAEMHFGSKDKFLAMVRQRGGVEAFYNEVGKDACTIGAVFARYDKNKNGSLEPSECICECSKKADFNKDGRVSKDEFLKLTKAMLGSQKKFEQFVKSQGGAEKFYTALIAGKLPKPEGIK